MSHLFIPSPAKHLFLYFILSLWFLLVYCLLKKAYLVFFSLEGSNWCNLCFICVEGKVFIIFKICVLYLSLAICFREKSAFFMCLALKLHRFQLFSESGYASKDLFPPTQKNMIPKMKSCYVVHTLCLEEQLFTDGRA